MTEAEWLTGKDPQSMVDFLSGAAHTRKLRLWACCCCRRIWQLVSDGRSHRSVEVAERFADGLASHAELDQANWEAGRATDEVFDQRGREIENWGDGRWEHEVCGDTCSATHACWLASSANFKRAHNDASQGVAHAADPLQPALVTWSDNPVRRVARTQEKAAQARLLREVFGNPFRLITFAATWRTSDVMLLARGIYDERAFDRMPILADALQDAGCDSDDILNHLRAPHAAHVRGCWALDLVLGKE